MTIEVIKNKKLNDYKAWPVWECAPSKFDWEYDKEEHCYVLEGEVRVEGADNTVDIVAGDYVIFSKGLKCVWEVKKAIKKHYSFY